MKNKSNLVEALKEDEKKFKNKLSQNKYYSIKNRALKLLVKSGMSIDYALPYILAAILLTNIPGYGDNSPFSIDKIEDHANVQTIETSSGINVKNTTYDFEYSDELLLYSTGWSLNEEGLYERVETSYKIKDEVDLNDTNKILSMSKEEVENLFEIKNIKTIKASYLSPEDYIYNTECLIIVNNFKSKDDFIIRKETFGENLIFSIIHILLVTISGWALNKTKRVLLKNRIKDKLNYYEESLKEFDKDDLEKLKEVLKVKEENLKMLDGQSKSLPDSVYYVKKR